MKAPGPRGSLRAHGCWLTATLLLSLACGPGPTVHLGRRVPVDAGPDAAVEEDGGDASRELDEEEDDDNGDDGDDDDVPCEDASACNSDFPYCHETRLICVECLGDEHCTRGERCDRGECEEP